MTGNVPVQLPRRRVRVCYVSQWAGALEPVDRYLARVPTMDLRPLVADGNDAALLRKARLDCDWYAENARCFASLQNLTVEFLPAWIVGWKELLQLSQAPREPNEERWLITTGQQPQALGEMAGKVFGFLAKQGVRIFYYAFDEASRRMPCFNAIAPFLHVLVHDESPLAESVRRLISPHTLTIHRSWVANLVPFASPLNETPEEKILFLGSQLGLSPHRQRQIEFLQTTFKDKFIASCDHSVGVSDRFDLSRYKVAFCPEGRMFATPAMAATHTDRPFWSGCLGMVPVSEDSQTGGRLESLHDAGMIVRYAHGDLNALRLACEEALETPLAQRRRIYQHFNAHETVGSIVADAIVLNYSQATRERPLVSV